MGGVGGLFNLARSLRSLRHSPLASLFCEASETARAHKTPRQRFLRAKPEGLRA